MYWLMTTQTLTRPMPTLTDWIGRTCETTGRLDAQAASMVQATLGAPLGDLRDGNPLPPLWHWYAFPPTVPMAELGDDGHPRLGDFLPPVPYDRRMWASGALTFHAPLKIGEVLTKSSRIANVVEKTGSSGGMVFVTVEHVLTGASGPAISERQDIVYLPIAPEFTPPPKRPGPTEGLEFDRTHPVSPALLFRYSAITFNAHRIHYDLPYARQVEHYPGLVVHGPLQANLLIAQATAHVGRAPQTFKFRGVHPMFHDSHLRLCATRPADSTLDLCTIADAGHIGMQATATWED